MTDETIYTMKIDGEFSIGDRVIECPECGQNRGLCLTAFVTDSSISVQCPSGHVWDLPNTPGRWVRDLWMESLVDPDRTIHLDGSVQ